MTFKCHVHKTVGESYIVWAEACEVPKHREFTYPDQNAKALTTFGFLYNRVFIGIPNITTEAIFWGWNTENSRKHTFECTRFQKARKAELMKHLLGGLVGELFRYRDSLRVSNFRWNRRYQCEVECNHVRLNVANAFECSGWDKECASV